MRPRNRQLSQLSQVVLVLVHHPKVGSIRQTMPVPIAALASALPHLRCSRFNSPQGMCDGCDGLGDVFTFDPDLLISDPTKSFQQGCIELVGKWKELGRWRRHIYKGVASTIERLQELPEGTLLETAWEELPRLSCKTSGCMARGIYTSPTLGEAATRR